MTVTARRPGSDRTRAKRLAAAAVVAAAAGALWPPSRRLGGTFDEPARPAFSGTDSHGRPVSLADYQGSVVVLEWTNHECPFVGRQYQHGNMQSLQKQAAADGVVWLTIVSSAPGEQGYVTGAEADKLTVQRGADPRAVILDPSGDIGHAYAAKTTPHMFVVDATGTLVYMGAIDDQPRIAGSDPAEAHNYVKDALGSLAAGKPVATPVTQAYGCSIKYKS
ncbi:MAG: redoxin domain-containing protein [Rhodospirillales bacterium]